MLERKTVKYKFKLTAVALANKLARICYATLRDQEPFERSRLTRKIERQAFSLPT